MLQHAGASRPNKNAPHPHKGERRACLRGPTSLCRRLTTTASLGANTPWLGNGSTRRSLLSRHPSCGWDAHEFRDAAHKGASGRHQHRLAPAAGSLGLRRALLSSLDAVKMDFAARSIPPELRFVKLSTVGVDVTIGIKRNVLG